MTNLLYNPPPTAYLLSAGALVLLLATAARWLTVPRKLATVICTLSFVLAGYLVVELLILEKSASQRAGELDFIFLAGLTVATGVFTLSAKGPAKHLVTAMGLTALGIELAVCGELLFYYAPQPQDAKLIQSLGWAVAAVMAGVLFGMLMRSLLRYRAEQRRIAK